MNSVYIFLDIDGVLNRQQVNRLGSMGIEKDLAFRYSTMIRIIEENGVTVNTVISSDWASIIHSNDMTLKGFKAMLESHEVHCGSGGIHSCLPPVHSSNSTRAEAILEHVEHNQIGSYIAIDDMNLLAAPPLSDAETLTSKNFEWVQGGTGITYKNSRSIEEKIKNHQ